MTYYIGSRVCRMRGNRGRQAAWHPGADAGARCRVGSLTRRGSSRGQHRRRRTARRAWGSAADVGLPALADGTAAGGEAEAGTSQGPHPAVTARAAGNILAIAQAADEASRGRLLPEVSARNPPPERLSDH